MKDNRNATHAPCPVRYRARGLDLCGATDTPCEYCADREPNESSLLRVHRRQVLASQFPDAGEKVRKIPKSRKSCLKNNRKEQSQ